MTNARLLTKRAHSAQFKSLTTSFCDVITVGNDVAVGVSGDGDDILDVVERRHQAVRDEEYLEVGALGRTDSGYREEADDGGLDKRRAVGERGNKEEVDEVIPGLLAPQGADGEASAPA